MEWDSTLAARFGAHYADVRGVVRTHVLQAHLRMHLRPPPATIVDVGGGAGQQALPLARLGYRVTIIDPSSAMLARAEAAVAAEAADVVDRVRLVHATGEHAGSVLGGERFDAVLCHGVLLYLDDPEDLMAQLCELAAPGAVLSIVTKNVRTLAVAPALAGDWDAAMAAFDATTQINRLGLPTRGDSVEDLTAAMDRHGVSTVAWYGVRLFTDGWTEPVPDAAAMTGMLAVELQASRRDPYRQLSRMFHLVGVKR